MDPENSFSNKALRVAKTTLPAIRRGCTSVFEVVGRFVKPPSQAVVAAEKIPFENLPVPDWKRPALVGYLIIILAFGGLGGWSAFARLDSAVVATGVVTLESSRKTVQHFEGGMVKNILVHEGQHVEQGDVLFKLDDTQSMANSDLSRHQLDGLLAQEARLMAERDRANQITFPPELVKNAAQPVIKDSINDQEKQFTERRASLDGQISILESRIKQYGSQLDGIAVERASTVEQLKFINIELEDLRGLLEKNLVQKTRVLAMEREKSRLEGVIGRADADTAKTQNDIGEAHLQIEQLHKKFSEEVNAQIVEVRSKISDLREKVAVSADVLHRVEIRAPRSGTVQNLHVTTIGGVIRPGEPLLELIPDDEGMVINAMVSPTDIDAIQAGMQAEIRFSAFHGQILPLMTGKIESISRDRIMDEQSKQPYFLARIVVDKEHVPTMVKEHIMAGMQTEVIVPTGERTVINYLVRPLRNRAVGALREK
jgi:HlyD family type I secretion membrane fusion protein